MGRAYLQIYSLNKELTGFVRTDTTGNQEHVHQPVTYIFKNLEVVNLTPECVAGGVNTTILKYRRGSVSIVHNAHHGIGIFGLEGELSRLLPFDPMGLPPSGSIAAPGHEFILNIVDCGQPLDGNDISRGIHGHYVGHIVDNPQRLCRRVNVMKADAIGVTETYQVIDLKNFVNGDGMAIVRTATNQIKVELVEEPCYETPYDDILVDLEKELVVMENLPDDED